MIKVAFLLFALALFPSVTFSQDMELGGTELNGNDVLDWNTPPISIPVPSAKMLLADSVIVRSNFENGAFYTELTSILKAGGFETESGVDYKKSGLKAHKATPAAQYEIIVTFFPKIFHSSTLRNYARVNFYAATAGSEVNAADAKSFDKLKNELAKLSKDAPTHGKAPVAGAFTADERRVVNQFSRRSIPAVDLINGTNTLQQIADQARLQKEEVAQILTFMIEKGFAHITKHGS